jgi:hypothetical protein
LERGNYLKTYKKITSANFFKNTNVVNGKVLIFDSKGNQSQLNLVLKHEANTVTEKKENKLEGTRFYYKTQNVFNQGDLSLIVPIRALYNDFDFLYKESSTSKYIGGKIYSIHKQDVPLHKYINLSLKLPESLLSYKDKLCLIEIEGSDISSIASKVEGDLLLAKIRSFGDYSIDIDSIPPSISFKSMNLKNKDKTIVFKITDDLSGISSYNAYLNNNWILFKYDYKTNELYYDLDNRLKVLNKEQELKIVVEDSKGNKSELIKRFTY